MENKRIKPYYNSEIPSDWQIKKLGNLGKIVSGLTYSPEDICEETGVLVLRSSNVQGGQISFDDNVFVKVNDGDFNPVKNGDILICVRNGSKTLIGKCALINENAEGMALGAFMAVFRGDYNNYLIHVFNTDIYNREIYRNLGATINSINGSDLKEFKIPFPPLPEQRAIASLLSTWDEAISKTHALIAQKEFRKKWLMQNLLTGKKRLKGFNEEWKNNTLKNILKVAGKPFIPVKNELYQQIGIRSHAKGIFYKDKVTGESLGNKRVFGIEPHCFVVNIVFAWEHAVAKTTENEIGMIASHRFPMYKPKKEILDLDYLLYYFKSSRGKYLLMLASPGGAGRNKTLGKSEFMNLQIPVPSIEEQTAIATIFQTADKEIQLLKAKLDKLKEQKKGLMQVLLTGKKRLKIDK